MSVDFRGQETAWNHLFRVVREKFPYSKMRGLTVKDGVVVSFNDAHYTFVFGRGIEPPRPLLPDTFDEQWQRFMRFCQSLQDGIVGEVHFTDGRPVLVSMQQPGMDLAPETPEEGGAIVAQNLVAA